jgi:phosphotransferase system HPr (HPr) family protein
MGDLPVRISTMLTQETSALGGHHHLARRHSTVAEGTIQVKNRYGLHTRTAPLVAKTAIQFLSRITIATNREQSSARSVLGLTSLGATHGTRLHVRAEGPDAKAAVHAMERLFDSNFGEA